MGKVVSGQHIDFVCVRAAHHRHMAVSPCLCDVEGWRGYCPAGDIGGHDWMPTSTDIATLRELGYCCGPFSDAPEHRVEEEGAALLIRR